MNFESTSRKVDGNSQSHAHDCGECPPIIKEEEEKANDCGEWVNEKR
jgi:hypothetical protein